MLKMFLRNQLQFCPVWLVDDYAANFIKFC